MIKTDQDVIDPYREWLDVRSLDRPLTAYQLLDLDPAEVGDEKVIEEAVRRKRELLRRCVGEAPSVLWRFLHQEVNQAAETLLDPRKKAEYDRRRFPAGVHVGDQRPDGPVACGACEAVNPPARAFCSVCGDPLLRPCAHCGAKNVSSEAYCGVCGANLAAALKERIENFEARLQEAESLQSDGHFDEALVLLSSMLSTSIPELESGVEQANEMLRRLPDRRAAAQQRVTEAWEQATALAAEHDYEEAVAAIEAAPAGMQSEEMQHRLQNWRRRADEINRLTREIRAAVMAKKTEHLLEKVEQLLVLRPGHPQAEKLRDQLVGLRNRSEEKIAAELRAQAKQLLTQQKYSEAERVLNETPQSSRREDFDKLYAFAKETAWLAELLQTAPVADRALAMAAKRLCKFSPKDLQAQRAAIEIEAAIQRGAADPRHAAPFWIEPDRAKQRYPVEWLGGFKRLRPAAACDAAPLRRRPGAFFVACGLALQGFDLAAAPLNLLPKKKKRLLDTFSRRGRKQTAAAAWGIDVGRSALKAVRLVHDPAGKVEIDACVIEEYAHDDASNSGEDQAFMQMRDALARFIAGRDLANDRLCISLGGVQVLPRFFRIPVVEESRIRDAVTFEVRHQIPVPLDELAWDFHIFPATPQADARVNDREVIVLAAKQWQLKHPLGVLKEDGLDVHAIQGEAAALYNFVRYEFDGELSDEVVAGEKSPIERPIVLLDVGRDATHYVYCSAGSTYFRSFPQGGEAFTKALVREFNLTLADAEALKRAPWKARAMQQWDEALEPVYRSFLEEVQRSEKSLGPERRIQRLYLVGGGAQLHGLLRRVGQMAVESNSVDFG